MEKALPWYTLSIAVAAPERDVGTGRHLWESERWGRGERDGGVEKGMYEGIDGVAEWCVEAAR